MPRVSTRSRAGAPDLAPFFGEYAFMVGEVRAVHLRDEDDDPP